MRPDTVVATLDSLTTIQAMSLATDAAPGSRITTPPTWPATDAAIA